MSFPILKKLRAIDVNAELNVILKSLEKQILAMNTEDQLFKKGVTITGVKIVPPYASSTVRIKKRKGQPTNRVTTRDTGEYHSHFTIQFGTDEFTIEVDHTNADLNYVLKNRYGELEGLTDVNVEKLSRKILPLLINAIKRKI